MNKKQIENISLIALIIIILLVPLYLLVERVREQKTNGEFGQKPEFVGRESCKQCHLKEYNLFKGSHHDMAMDHATDSTVLGDFNNVEFTSANGTKHKFYKKDCSFFVLTDGPNGQMQEFEIKYTFGFTPLQQYLVEFPGGRLQTLALTWNSVDNNWYHMADSIYKNQNVDHNNWLHWTNQAQNWNSMCADCHSTNLQKNYNVETDSYNTSWSEIDVSCEACHGPSSLHIEWANLPEYSRSGFKNFGLPVKTSNIDNKTYVDQCARCHSRRSSLSDYKLEEENIYQHMVPELPVPTSWHIDGQILDEDYVYASFTQSKMYMHDVKCNDCHEVHSTKRLFEGNKLCTQCHIADKYDTPEHHFHKLKGEVGKPVISEAGVKFEVGSGSECINCHMHAQYYMGVDYRNDHSFRIPRPDLSEQLGTPNACNQCHANKSNKWAQTYVEKWYGKSSKFHYGEAFSAATNGDLKAIKKLNAIYFDDNYPEIIRATAIQYLALYFQDSAKTTIFNALLNTHPLIRYTALRGLNVNTQESLTKLLPLLLDEVKAIRLETANKLMGIPKDRIPGNYNNSLLQATDEYHEYLKYNADFPVGKFNLANYYYNQQNFAEAEKFYLAALKQDEQLHTIKINLAYLYNTIGKPEKAELLFKSYLESNPEDGNIMFSYGLLLSELKKYKESLDVLIKASVLQPENSRLHFNIAMMFDFFKDKTQTEKYLKACINIEPGNPNYYSALQKFYAENKMQKKLKILQKEIELKFKE